VRLHRREGPLRIAHLNPEAVIASDSEASKGVIASDSEAIEAVIASEAKQSSHATARFWIASSLSLLAMTI